MLALVVVEAAAILLLGVLVAGLLRSHADILRSLHELGAGVESDDRGSRQPVSSRIGRLAASETAHDVVGQRLDGDAVSVGVVGARVDTLLIFLSSGCLSCRPFWDELAQSDVLPGDLRTLVVVQDEDSVPHLRELSRGVHADVVASSAAWMDYGVPGSPHAVLVHGPTGRVTGEGTAGDLRQLLDLLLRAGGTQVLLPGDDRDNAARIDQELAAVGIGPGHASLSPEPIQRETSQ